MKKLNFFRILIESKGKILFLYKILKEFLTSLEPKTFLSRKSIEGKNKPNEINSNEDMDIDEDREINLTNMQKTYKKNQINKNKINLFEMK